jgi:hypothetical protein
MAHTTMITTYYGLSREVWATLAALITRMKVAVPSLPSLPKQFSRNRWSTTTIDAMVQAVAALDGKAPSKLFDNRNWRFDRDIVAQLVALEARITALGY